MRFFSSCLFVFLVLCLTTKTASASYNDDTKNYITWDDLKVDGDYRLNLKYARDNQSQRVIVVDQNGGGDSTMVQDAVNMVSDFNTERVKIHIRPGIYSEKVTIPKTKGYISFIGDENQANQTVITWHDKAGDKDDRGLFLGTSRSASVNVEANYFCASEITFENTVVQTPGVVGNQAVALRISGDRAVFYKSRILGSQDTLLDQEGTHYFYKCFIQGVTDFIFGNAKSLYEGCNISIGNHGYSIAAQHRGEIGEDTGFTFLNCTIIGQDNSTVLLARAWADYSRVIYAYCDFDINVGHGGWSDWGFTSRQNTTDFGEYQCTGRGADSERVSWSEKLNDTEAKPFLNTAFINAEEWLRLY